MSLLQMSFSGAVFIIAIVMIRAVTINRLPKKTFLVLWELVLLRLLIPFSIPSMFSVYTLIIRSMSGAALPGAETSNVIPTIQEQFVTMRAMEQLPENIPPAVSMWFIVWCAGMILFVLFFAVSYLRCLTEFKTALPVHNDFVEKWLKERPLKRPIAFSLVLACFIVAGTATAFATSAQAGNDNLSLEDQDRMLNATASITAYDTMLSYTDPQDGKTYYSMDDGKTFEVMTEEEYEQRFPTPNVEWWTYEEYKEWLENEKIQLQSLIGERAWTGGRGEFVWTQEIVDEAIAMYEETLQDIKNGMKVSKSVDGDDTYIQMAYNPIDISTSEKALSLFIVLSNGEEVEFGPYETVEELLSDVEPFCAEQVKLGNMEQSEADEILSKYTEK